MKASDASLEIEIAAGIPVVVACQHAIRIAGVLGVMVEFDFNGVRVMAKPGACPRALAGRFEDVLRGGGGVKCACVHDPAPPENLVLDELRFLVSQSSAASVAMRLDCSPQYICDVLNGRRGVSERMAAALGFARVVSFVPKLKGGAA